MHRRMVSALGILATTAVAPGWAQVVRITPVPLPFQLHSAQNPAGALSLQYLRPPSHAGRGALIGAAVGAAAIAIVVLLHHDSNRESAPGLAIEIPFSVGALASVGGLIGSTVPNDPSARNGTIAGSITGAVLSGWALSRFCRHQSSFADDPCVRYTAFGAEAGAVLGALVGYGFGSKSDRNPQRALVPLADTRASIRYATERSRKRQLWSCQRGCAVTVGKL